jgi:heme exporter protein D
LREFLAMGGYAAYVWAAFGFAALVLLALLAQSWRVARRRQAELEQLRHIVRPRRPPAPPRLRPTRPAPGLAAGSRPSAKTAE